MSYRSNQTNVSHVHHHLSMTFFCLNATHGLCSFISLLNQYLNKSTLSFTIQNNCMYVHQLIFSTNICDQESLSITSLYILTLRYGQKTYWVLTTI